MKENTGRKQGAPSPCSACKILRRRCAQDCVFAPYFPADEPQKFANVDKVFGASNVNKLKLIRKPGRSYFLRRINSPKPDPSQSPLGRKKNKPRCLSALSELQAVEILTRENEELKKKLKTHAAKFIRGEDKEKYTFVLKNTINFEGPGANSVNHNIGPGAGGLNSGEKAGSINAENMKGSVNFGKGRNEGGGESGRIYSHQKSLNLFCKEYIPLCARSSFWNPCVNLCKGKTEGGGEGDGKTVSTYNHRKSLNPYCKEYIPLRSRSSFWNPCVNLGKGKTEGGGEGDGETVSIYSHRKSLNPYCKEYIPLHARSPFLNPCVSLSKGRVEGGGEGDDKTVPIYSHGRNLNPYCKEYIPLCAQSPF